MQKKLVLILFLVNRVFSNCCDLSPFQLVDKYIDEFKHDFNEMKKVSQEYLYIEEKFNSEKYNETLALAEAIEYDFIIVGGGTSGSVLANRLSEIPEWKILLLEAGPPEESIGQVPKFENYLKNTPYNWGFITSSQNHSCLGMIDNKCAIPMGKSLGGSSSINNMLYIRGNARDYDIWADQENADWCWSDVLPYYRKIEDSHLEHYDKKYHHQGGPQHIEIPRYLTNLSDAILAASNHLGYDIVDYNGKHQKGFSLPQMSTKLGRRNSVAQTYLKPAYYRKNLVVIHKSQVIKLNITPHTKDVKSVEYLHDDKLFAAKAEKEVILAAGPINTPKLLLLSGIGPVDDLKHFNIDPLEDLKVGKNLKNHMIFDGLHFIYEHQPAHLDEYNEILNYLKHYNGPYSTPGIEILGFLKTEVSKDHAHYPDIQLEFKTTTYSELEGKILRLKPEYCKIYKEFENKIVVTIKIILLHPKSTGSVKLWSKDPLEHPVIDTNHLTDEEEDDLKTLLAGIKQVLKISHTDSFNKLGLNLTTTPIHGCDSYKFGSDDYWICAIKHLAYTSGDVMGTTRMGPSTDKEAVVDKRLKVYGINKLRIADTSVIPVSISASNLMATTILIGEKAADLIKEDWK